MWPRDMEDRHYSPQFGINLFNDFQENRFDGWTHNERTDGHLSHDGSSAVQ